MMGEEIREFSGLQTSCPSCDGFIYGSSTTVSGEDGEMLIRNRNSGTLGARDINRFSFNIPYLEYDDGTKFTG